MRVALSMVLVLLAPSLGAAQTIQSFQDLALRVNLDDQIRVEDRSGATTAGRLTHLTREDIAILTGAGEKRFAGETVRDIAVRSPSFRKGALIGAGVFAVLGAVATCSHEGGGTCIIIGTLGGAPIGAGVGLAMAALIPQMKTVYRAPETAVFLSRAAIGGPSLLEDLALRVNLDDQLRVEDRSGVRTTGRLTRLTDDEIAMQTSAGEKHFTRETVGRIAVRRQPFRAAVLIGAGVGAAAGALAACTGSEREECVDAPIMAAALGAGVGLAAGALIHRTTIVYPESDRRALMWPVISRDAVGVMVALRW
jgi:hypothetical protein